jgi:replicative DNA helicase
MTNYPQFDDITGGIGHGQFIVIGARPSVGKTTLALNFALRLSNVGAHCLFFSLEMSKLEITKSIMRCVNQKPIDRNICPSDFADMARAVRGKSIKIEEATGATPSIIASKYRQIKRKQPVDVIFIDYIQRMKGDGKSNNRYEEMTKISTDIANLAHGSHVTIFALAQLNRAMEVGAQRKPRLADLRETGAIEQDADIVMLLSNQKELADGEISTGIQVVDLEIAKNRTGPVGNMKMCFDKPLSTFIGA